MTYLADISGSWMFGYQNGVIGGCIVLPSFHHEFNLPPVGTSKYSDTISNIVSFLQIGALAGSLLIFSVVRKLGRRWALGCGAGFFFIGSIMQVFAHGSLNLMYTGRAIAGIGLGSVTVLVPMVIFHLKVLILDL
jgi:MFS family permease